MFHLLWKLWTRNTKLHSASIISIKINVYVQPRGGVWWCGRWKRGEKIKIKDGKTIKWGQKLCKIAYVEKSLCCCILTAGSFYIKVHLWTVNLLQLDKNKPSHASEVVLFIYSVPGKPTLKGFQGQTEIREQ